MQWKLWWIDISRCITSNNQDTRYWRRLLELSMKSVDGDDFMMTMCSRTAFWTWILLIKNTISARRQIGSSWGVLLNGWVGRRRRDILTVHKHVTEDFIGILFRFNEKWESGREDGIGKNTGGEQGCGKGTNKQQEEFQSILFIALSDVRIMNVLLCMFSEKATVDRCRIYTCTITRGYFQLQWDRFRRSCTDLWKSRSRQTWKFRQTALRIQKRRRKWCLVSPTTH